MSDNTIFHQKHQCLISALVGQKDQFSVSAYHRRSETDPDIESGPQGDLLIPPSRLQTLSANDLVCAPALLFVFSVKYRTKIMGKACCGSGIPARMTYAALERHQNQCSLTFSCPFDFKTLQISFELRNCTVFDRKKRRNTSNAVERRRCRLRSKFGDVIIRVNGTHQLFGHQYR